MSNLTNARTVVECDFAMMASSWTLQCRGAAFNTVVVEWDNREARVSAVTDTRGNLYRSVADPLPIPMGLAQAFIRETAKVDETYVTIVFSKMVCGHAELVLVPVEDL